MSGALGVIATVGGVGGAVADLLGLDQTDITLGGFTFSGVTFEVPARMRWGVEQRTVRHLMPGGLVRIDAMGSDWPPISWKGIFDGPGAGARAKSLAAMTKAAELLTLTWMDRTYLVVIRRFVCTDVTNAWLQYEITCEVAADADQIAGPPAPPTLGQQITSDISDALGFNVVDAANQAATVLGKVSQAAGLVGALIPGSGAFTALSSAAGIAGGVVGSAIPLAEGALNGLGTVVGGVTKAANWITGAVTGAGNLAAATGAQGYIGRVQANVAGAGG